MSVWVEFLELAQLHPYKSLFIFLFKLALIQHRKPGNGEGLWENMIPDPFNNISSLQLHKNKILIYLIWNRKKDGGGKIDWGYAMFSIIYLCLCSYIMLPCIICYLPLLYMLVTPRFLPWERRQQKLCCGQGSSGKNYFSLRALGCIFMDFIRVLTYLTVTSSLLHALSF